MQTIHYGGDVYTLPPTYPCRPDQARSFVENFHASDNTISAAAMDTILFGLPNVAHSATIQETLAPNEAGERQYGNEAVWSSGQEFIWTPYTTLRSIVWRLDPKHGQVFYDLGAGYGRLPIYAGITTPAACKGIELVRERAELAQNTIERLELDNVSMIEGSVLDQDISDGDMFYMYAPFSSETKQKVFGMLKEVARQKPIQVVMRSAPANMDQHSWLEPKREIAEPNRSDPLIWYESV